MTVMTVDLSGCRAKIERAQEHREGLDTIIGPIQRGEYTNVIQMSAKRDPETGYHIYRVAAIPEHWQTRVGLILGDVVHNLRSALDYLFWQLYRTHIRVPQSDREAQQVQFPIEDTSQRLANKRNNFRSIP